MARRSSIHLGTLALCLLAAACAMPSQEGAPALALEPLPADASDAELALDAIARAQAAADAGNTAELGRQLGRIDALGVQFEDAEDQQQVALWHAMADLAPPMRGRVNGPGVRRGALAPGSSVEFAQAFLAGERAAIALQARRGPAVEITIIDGQNETLCTRRTRRGACVWVPVFTQRHVIRLTNEGDDTAHYHLAID